jgi:RimJ/RimL family protein N-acetyltransferase
MLPRGIVIMRIPLEVSLFIPCIRIYESLSHAKAMLRGERVGLRPLETQDVYSLLKWFNDQMVLEDLGAEHTFFCVSLEEEKVILERMLRDVHAQWFIIVKLEEGEPIGIIGLTNMDERNASAEMRVVIGEIKEWGKGLGVEAVRLLLSYGFDSRGLHRIWLRVADYNERAIRLYRKCGFVEEGRSRHDHYHKGRWQDAYRMSILDSEWRSG